VQNAHATSLAIRERHQKAKSNHLSCADDILLLAEYLGVLQNGADVVCPGLKEIDLFVANSKTEFLVFGKEIASNDAI